MTYIITDGTKYYCGIERQKRGIMKDEIEMSCLKICAKHFSNIEHATAASKRLKTRFGMKLKAEQLK